MASALLIIDVQQALCCGDDAAYDIELVIDRINTMSAKARAVGAPVILIQHEDDGSLQLGTDGWQLDARLQVSETDLRIRKTACDSFHHTDLQEVLTSRGVDRLMVCGLQSEFCVDTTVRVALARGYPVTLVSDGHSTVDNGVLSAARISTHHNTTLAHLGSFGPRVTAIPAAEVCLNG
ncbi:cysteine hydrolase family protein [Rhodoferax sp.]|uniref:cysteine hydrolase family protein n=1 Tax=Rhodoferax sp. TaxID=50421 RepID=UPI00283D9400|nr:cysteine hydrolase family protein [Rhodoferax sp.]MDR3371415.1 cysteine hydrolase family protein [Rhodoferax sp.]